MLFFYLLISVMPLVFHPFWSMFVGDLTMIKYLGAICFIYALVYKAERSSPVALFHTWQARFFILFLALSFVSYMLMGSQISFESSPIMLQLSFVLLFLTTLIVVDSPGRLRNVLLAGVGSVAFASIYVLREWQKAGFSAKSRPGWVTGDANYFTVSALIFLPVAFCLMFQPRSTLERVFCGGCLSLTLLAVIAASSRGGFLALFVMAMFLVWRKTRRVGAPILAVALLLLLSVVSPASPLDRLLNPVKGDIDAQEIRLLIWEAGLRVAADHPLIGIGTANFSRIIQRYYLDPDTQAHVAHNTYVEVAAELGIPGLILFLLSIFTTMGTLEAVRRRAVARGSIFMQDAALSMQAGLLGYLISAFFLSATWHKFLWLVIFLSMCLPLLERDPLKTTPQRTQSRTPGKVTPVAS